MYLATLAANWLATEFARALYLHQLLLLPLLLLKLLYCYIYDGTAVVVVGALLLDCATVSDAVAAAVAAANAIADALDY